MAPTAESWIESSDVVSMFPTFVWNIQLTTNACTSINAKILKTLDEMHRDLPPLAAGQTRQSPRDFHELNAIQGLVVCIQNASASVLKFMRIGYEEIVITGCWANINATGASHEIHNHPNNFLSGVYYVQTQPGADTINFHDPRIQTGIIRPPVTELTAENTDQVVVRVKSGTLLVFPSYMQHSVSPNGSDRDRISVSFNIMFASFTENMSKPLW